MSRLARLTVAALILAAPVASFADSSASAMDACLAAFLKSDIAKDRKVTVHKNVDPKPQLLSLSGAYKIELVAKGRESGKELARVVCDADSKGTIVAVNGRPTGAVASLALSR